MIPRTTAGPGGRAGGAHPSARVLMLRAVVAGLVALGGMVVADRFGRLDGRAGLSDREVLLAVLGAGLTLLSGLACVRWAARATRVAMLDRAGEGRAGALSLLTRIVGYVLVAMATLGALQVNLGNLLLGGAVTGIFLGIAAQQVLANFFAGIVLLVVRPFEVGQHLALRSGSLGAEYSGTVTDMGAFYVRLRTSKGPVNLPNASVLAAAVGPGALTRAADEGDAAEPEAPVEPGEPGGDGARDGRGNDNPTGHGQPAPEPGAGDPADPNR